MIKKLVKIRNQNKVTQKQMADNLRITPTTLSRYENGLRIIPSDLLFLYAEALDYEIRLLKK